MRKPLTLVHVLIAILVASVPATTLHAATLVINADVYTLDPEMLWAESFAYDDDGKIIAVGKEADLLSRFGDTAKIIDADGHMVLPGFQDVHVHVPEAGINQSVCLLPSSRSLNAYAKLIRGCAARQKADHWVRAAGVSLFELRDTDTLPIDMLDQAVPDRPVLILDDLGHAVWTNSAGLRAAGIDTHDANPQGGVLHRDRRSGKLTGLLLEDAQQLVRNAAAPAEDAVYEGLLGAFDELARNGITAISDAGGYWMQQHPMAWQRAVDEGRYQCGPPTRYTCIRRWIQIVNWRSLPVALMTTMTTYFALTPPKSISTEYWIWVPRLCCNAMTYRWMPVIGVVSTILRLISCMSTSIDCMRWATE